MMVESVASRGSSICYENNIKPSAPHTNKFTFILTTTATMFGLIALFSCNCFVVFSVFELLSRFFIDQMENPFSFDLYRRHIKWILNIDVYKTSTTIVP